MEMRHQKPFVNLQLRIRTMQGMLAVFMKILKIIIKMREDGVDINKAYA